MLVPFDGDFLRDDEAIATLSRLASELFADLDDFDEVCVEPAFGDGCPEDYRELKIRGVRYLSDPDNVDEDAKEKEDFEWSTIRALPPGWSAIEVSRIFSDGGNVYFSPAK